MISYSQNREDVMLGRVFASTKVGFYVDIGAHHPIHWSVTKHFYERGWRGINIEPGLTYQAIVADRRRDVNLNIALSDHSGAATFYEFPEEMGVSTMVEGQAERQAASLNVAFTEREVPVRTLAEVCREHVHQPIEFMSIDVEGFERQVIAGADWGQWRPKVLLVEATVPNQTTTNHHEWERLLLESDYLFAYFDGLNRFYVRSEDRQLAEVFRIPPNVFDRYEIHAHAEQMALLENLRERDRLWAARQAERQREQLAELHLRLRDFEKLGRLPIAVARRVFWLTNRFPRAYTLMKRAGSGILRRTRRDGTGDAAATFEQTTTQPPAVPPCEISDESDAGRQQAA